MDGSSIYGINKLSGSQLNGHEVDTSMTGIPQDRMDGDFDTLPMAVDAYGLRDGIKKSYTLPDTVMSDRNIRTGTMDVHMNSAIPVSPQTDCEAQETLPVSSMLAQFTKKGDWPQCMVEELEDLLHILTPDGRIIYLSPSSKRITGYPQEELLGKFLIEFIHPDDGGVFMRDFNESISCGSPLQLFYRFRKGDGSYTILESRGHPHLTSEAAGFGSNTTTGFCRGYFMMARPYPTKNAALLDSFLEHKIENERLKKRIYELKKEEAEEAEEDQAQLQRKQGWRQDILPEDIDAMGGIAGTRPLSPTFTNHNAMVMPPPPAKPSSMNRSLTRQALENANANSRPDSINDKMSRYEGYSHIEAVEMLTGLQYQDGERSHGISTGDESPTLVRGDAGITIPVNRDIKSGDKKKKIKLPDEYVCTDCGTLDSPEWRKGPSGPKTLCNACGLRWAKKEKRKSFSSPVPLMPHSLRK